MTPPLAVWLDGAVAALLVLGSLCCLAGAIGLWRLPDPAQRLHAPTLMASLGGACLALACTLWALHSGGRWLPLVVYGLLLVTTPLSGQALTHAIRQRYGDGGAHVRPATPLDAAADTLPTPAQAGSTHSLPTAPHALPRTD